MSQNKVNWSAVWWPLVISLLLTVAYRLGDGYILRNLIISGDSMISSLVYLTMGAIIGFIINYLLCFTPLAQLVDRSFYSIHVGSRKDQLLIAIIGFLSTAATGLGLYLWSSKIIDPSLIIPFTSLSIVLIAIWEWSRGRVHLKMGLPLILLIIGSLALLSWKENVNLQTTCWGLAVIVLIAYNLLAAIAESMSKIVVDKIDAVSFNFWRFFWMVATAIPIVILVAALKCKLSDYQTLLIYSLNAKTILSISVLMIAVFFASGLGNRAMALSNATFKSSIMAGQLVLSILVVLVLNYIVPGILPPDTATTVEWMLRIVGAILLMVSLINIKKAMIH